MYNTISEAFDCWMILREGNLRSRRRVVQVIGETRHGEGSGLNVVYTLDPHQSSFVLS